VGPGQYDPAGHGLELSAEHCDPAGHGKHEDDPLRGAMVLAGHGLGAERPATSQ